MAGTELAEAQVGRPGPSDGPGEGGATPGLQAALIRLAAIAVMVAVWWLISRAIGTDILPGPSVVAKRMVHVIGHEGFAANLSATLGRVLAGLVISLVIAVVVGVAMGLSRTMERLLDWPMLAGRVMPGLAWALLALMVIGVSGRAPILAVSVAVAPLLTVQLCEATKALDPDLFEMAKVFGPGRWRKLRELVIPALAPSIVGGAKLGLALSWKVAVLAELFGVNNGVGFEINQNFQKFSLDGVLAWAFLFAIVMALIEYGVIGPLYSRLTRWRRPGAPYSVVDRMLRQARWGQHIDDKRESGKELR